MKNRVIVIGGAGGIGSKIVFKYALAGSDVIVGDIDEKKGHDVVETSEGSIIFIPVNVLERESIGFFANAIQERFGWVNHVISLAGRAIEGEFEGLAGSTFDMIERSIHLNLQSHIFLTKMLLPLVEKSLNPNKTITLISSINAVKDFGLPAYSSAKAGLLGFVHSSCRELGGKNIRINAVLPGSVDTPLTRTEPKDTERLKQGTALGRIATDEEIANVVYAVTELMTCVTGQDIIADCGQTMMGFV